MRGGLAARPHRRAARRPALGLRRRGQQATAVTEADAATGAIVPTLSAEGNGRRRAARRVLARQEARDRRLRQVIPAPAAAARPAGGLLPRPGTGTRRRAAEGDAGRSSDPAEPSAEAIDLGELKNERERLDFLYEVESATIEEELERDRQAGSDDRPLAARLDRRRPGPAPHPAAPALGPARPRPDPVPNRPPREQCAGAPPPVREYCPA